MSLGGTSNPPPGTHARFVRYVSTEDGWTTEIRRGVIEDRSDTAWRVRVLDEIHELPKSEWSVFHP